MKFDIEDSIEHLGDYDKQVNRIIWRKKYFCPRCGKPCDVNYHYVKGKKAIDSDITLNCDSCGTVSVEVEVKGNKKVHRFKDTKKKCTIQANVKELYKIVNGKIENIEDYVRACDRLAEEIRGSGGTKDDLYPVYVREMLALLQDCKNTTDKNIVMMCEHTLDCNNVSKLELLDVLREVYRYIEQRESLIPENLYYTVMVEKILLDDAYDGRLFGPGDSFFLFDHYAEMYSGLSDEEYLKYPSTPMNAYIYAKKVAEREGLTGKVKQYKKKAIAAIEEYFDRGAKSNFTIVNYYINLIRDKYQVATKRVAVLDKQRKRWRNNAYFVAGSASACAYDLMDHYSSERTKESISAIDESIRNMIVKYADEAIEAMESMVDFGRASLWLVDSYAIRGMLTDNEDDLKKAVYYSNMFARSGLIRPDDYYDFVLDMEEYLDTDILS